MIHGCHTPRNGFVGTAWHSVISHFHASLGPAANPVCSHAHASWLRGAAQTRGLLCPRLLNLSTSIPTPANPQFSRAKPMPDLPPHPPQRGTQFSFIHTFRRTQHGTQVQWFFPQNLWMYIPPSIICSASYPNRKYLLSTYS